MFRLNAPQPFPVGLIASGKHHAKVPLKSTSVQAKLCGYVVGLKSVLKYSNEGTEPLEVSFRFPIDESFAVVGLEAVIAGKKIRAQLKEKEKAKMEYDDAIASGYTAALAEENTTDIFNISLGNLPAKSDAEIHLQLVGELPLDAEGAIMFSLPSVLKPRYTPTGSVDPLELFFGAYNQGQQAAVHAVIEFSLNIMEPDYISEVTSPTHTITTQRDARQIHISLDKPKPLVTDLVVLVSQKDPHTPRAITEPGNANLSQQKYMGSPAVMLNFFPKFETKHAACELIFVIDRSGSMAGSYITSARETLLLFLKSMSQGCRFNIIGFGSSYKVLFPGSVEYNQANLDTAVSHVENLGANLAGTELLGPLKFIFSLPLVAGLSRQVFVLTDGSVSNTRTCIQEVKNNVSQSRYVSTIIIVTLSVV